MFIEPASTDRIATLRWVRNPSKLAALAASLGVPVTARSSE
jgi:hypothetical protein